MQPYYVKALVDENATMFKTRDGPVTTLEEQPIMSLEEVQEAVTNILPSSSTELVVTHDDKLGEIVQIPEGSVFVKVDDTHQGIVSPAGTILTGSFADHLIEMATPSAEPTPDQAIAVMTPSPMIQPMLASPKYPSPSSPLVTGPGKPCGKPVRPPPGIYTSTLSKAEVDRMMQAILQVDRTNPQPRERATSAASDHQESDASVSYVQLRGDFTQYSEPESTQP